MRNNFMSLSSPMVLLCFVLITGCGAGSNLTSESGSATESGSTTGSVSAEIPGEAVLTGISYHSGDTVTINVPEMHCPFYCYPKVEETLTDLGGIKEMKLVAQKKEDKIDDPRIVISFSKDFDWDTAVKALEEVGFAGATVVTTD